MKFHESYGMMPASTLRLIKSNNVSPADWDGILWAHGHEWAHEYDHDSSEPPWGDIEKFIKDNSTNKNFRHPL